MPPTLERRYRALSYGFRILTDLPDVLDGIDRLLAPFAVPETGEGWPTFEIRAGGSARYEVSLDGAVCQRTDTSETLIEYMAWKASLGAIETTDTYLVLHAGAVARGGRGLILPAPPDSGKTTLTAALTLDGFDYLSDEAALIEPDTGLLHPFPRALWMEAPSLDAVGIRSEVVDPDAERRAQYHVVPAQLRGDAVGAPCRVRFVIFPSYRPGSTVALKPMSRAEAVVVLAENSFNLARFGADGVRLVADVVRGAECYRLSMGDLDEAVRCLRATVG